MLAYPWAMIMSGISTSSLFACVFKCKEHAGGMADMMKASVLAIVGP